MAVKAVREESAVKDIRAQREQMHIVADFSVLAGITVKTAVRVV